MTRGILKIILVLVVAVFLSVNFAQASEDELRQEIAALKAKLSEMDAIRARVIELEKKLDEQGCAIRTQGSTVQQIRESFVEYKPGEGVKVPPCGIEITAGATFVLQGTPNANNAGDGEASRFDAAWSADIFIQHHFEEWGLAFMHLEPGQGVGVENELSLYSNVNRDQNDTGANIPITELWYEHYLFNRQIAFTAGKMDPANYLDQNAFAHDETTQYIGRIFRQNPAIEWPNDNTIGASLIIAPEILPYLTFQTSWFDANNDWEDIFDRPFISAQVNFKPSKAFKLDMEQWDGNYRFYWWLNAMDHSKLVGAGESPADNIKNNNYGFGLSFDQMITDTFGAFARFGCERSDLALASSNSNAAQCEASWSGGLQMTGKYWKRDEDILAFAIGQVFPGKHYKDVGVANTGGAAEGHLELCYRCRFFKWLAITPDFQWIWNPHGINHEYLGDANTIFVYGVRGQLDF